jgi:hypothetical protein
MHLGCGELAGRELAGAGTVAATLVPRLDDVAVSLRDLLRTPRPPVAAVLYGCAGANAVAAMRRGPLGARRGAVRS